MTREVLDFRHQFQRETEPAIGEIQPFLRCQFVDAAVATRSPRSLSQPPSDVL
jgi:hypothetical protein